MRNLQSRATGLAASLQLLPAITANELDHGALLTTGRKLVWTGVKQIERGK